MRDLWMLEDSTPIQAYFVGVILLTVRTNGTDYARDSLCVDLFTDIVVGSTYDTVVLHPYEVPGKNLGRVSWLVDNALLPTQNPYPSALPPNDWVTNPVQGAAIQMAVWDIVHDGGDGLSHGRVQAATGVNATDPAVVAAAEHYLAVSAGKISNLAFIYDNYSQGSHIPAQMLAGPLFQDGGPIPAPEPSLLFCTGAALVLISRAAARRKRAMATGRAAASTPKDPERFSAPGGKSGS